MSNWSQYGVSPDGSQLMVIGKPSTNGESKYGYTLYQSIFQRKCPYCGSSELYWGIWWNGSETSGRYAPFPATGRSEGGSAEGHIFCKACDADFSCILGKAHVGGGKSLTRISGPDKSSRADALKLKAGEMPFNGTSSGDSDVERKTITYRQGRVYYLKTDANGNAILPVSLGLGNYTIKTTVQKEGYNNIVKNNSIDVVSEAVVDEDPSAIEMVSGGNISGSVVSGVNGYIWVQSSSFDNLNKTSTLQSLKANKINHILLHSNSISKKGANAISNFANMCNSYGLNLHIWMQMCYTNGSWSKPLVNGSINTSLLNQKLSEARTYAGISGVGGVHLDYMRYPGNAYNDGVNSACDAICTFVEQIGNAAKSVNSEVVLSGAIMPETSSGPYYYGQDVSMLSSYLDVFMPMVYVGNYKHVNDATTWLANTTKYYVNNCNGKAVWMGLQGYHSDTDTTLWDTTTLSSHARACLNSGASGWGLFRYGLTNYPKV